MQKNTEHNTHLDMHVTHTHKCSHPHPSTHTHTHTHTHTTETHVTLTHTPTHTHMLTHTDNHTHTHTHTHTHRCLQALVLFFVSLWCHFCRVVVSCQSEELQKCTAWVAGWERQECSLHLT